MFYHCLNDYIIIIIILCRTALDLREHIQRVKVPHLPTKSLQIRVGINTGMKSASIQVCFAEPGRKNHHLRAVG